MASGELLGARAEVLVVQTRGGEVHLRVEVTESGRLYICSEAPRGSKEELRTLGVIAVATGLAQSMELAVNPLVHMYHLRSAAAGNHIVGVPDAIEISGGADRAVEFVAILRHLLAGEAL